MLQQLVLQPAVASVLVAAAPGARAQAPPPATLTTKILATGTFGPGTNTQLVQRTLVAEARPTAELYLEGKIAKGYSPETPPGVCFILMVPDMGAAQPMLKALPRGKAPLMPFNLSPMGPLNPLRQLLKPPEAN